MLSVVAYPQQQQQPTMYVAAQPTYYYAQTTAGQWTSVPTVAQAGGVSNGAYVLQPQQIRTQAPTTTAPQPTSYIAVPQAQQRVATTASGAVVATRPVAVAQPQPQVYTQAPQVAYRAGPPTIAVPTVRPGLQRKHSSASMHGRRDSFDSQDSRSGMFIDREEYNRAPSPVLSETTSSSSSSSSSSHLNLSRSALNHYLAPQKTRPRRESIMRRGSSYDLPGPVTSRPPMALPAPGPQQAMVPIHPQPTRSATYPPPSGIAPPMAAEPAFVRTADLSGRPVSFHEDQNPVYSSYELYNNNQRSSPSASRPPTIKPALVRRASSRSLGGAGELSASAYGAGFGMGGGPAMGIMGGGYDSSDKRKWWKGGR
ncbi:hypothetical protein FS837_003301 [Tulasnella sp. UAMH 9824]|nr:hypothetical protein FS837_003301 [Tulasnella sp. UAMH 9824]